MLESFHFETFAPRRGETFCVHFDTEDRVELTLIEATNFTPATSGPGDGRTGERFSLVFRGPRERLLPQRIYEFEHEALGRFPLFITAIGVEEEGFLYESVFNRPPRASASTP